MKTRIIPILVLLLLVDIAMAKDFDMTIEPVNNEIYLDQNAQFSLTITNLKDYEDFYQIYTSDVAWYLSTNETIGRLAPGEVKTLLVELIPNVWTNIGPQRVKFIVKSGSTESKQITDIPVYVKPWDFEGRDYLASFELRVNMPEEIDPRTVTKIDITLRNRNRLNAENVKVILESTHFNKELNFPVGPLEEKSEEILFYLDPLTSPMEDELEIAVYYGNTTTNTRKKAYLITGYSELVKSIDQNQYFFKTTKDITITNEGNVANGEAFKIPVSLIEKWFSSTEPDATFVKEGKQGYLAWDIQLSPKDSTKIKMTTNYRLIPLSIIILIMVVALYYINRSPIVSKKDALIISTPSGGISELKVVIHVKNRTQDVITNVHVTDKIPRIAELVKESSIGTIEPTKILRNEKKGTLLKWEMASLDPFEERVITYRTKSKLNIIGGIFLPSAKVRFDTKNGKERVIYSNKTEVRI